VLVQGCIKQVSKLDRFLTVNELPDFMGPLGSLSCFQDYYGYLCYQYYNCFMVWMAMRTRWRSYGMHTFSSFVLNNATVDHLLLIRLRLSDQSISMSVTASIKSLPVHIRDIYLTF
jgi:hypothetical protein